MNIASFGFNTAMSEITLVLFTTLAPAGVLACALMALAVAFAPMSAASRERVSHAVAVPLVVSMVGLIASATHLGNPANALYVFAGVGRSPLSTEVFTAVVFLAVCGVYWLFSFMQRERRAVQRVWCVGIAVAGAGCIAGIAFAYSAETIVSWRSPLTQANVVLAALAGGPLLGMLGLRIARAECLTPRCALALCGVSAAALAANAATLVLQNAQLADGVFNAYSAASLLVPHYPAMIAAYVVLAGAGIALATRAALAARAGADARIEGAEGEGADARGARGAGAEGEGSEALPALPPLVAAPALFFVGQFIVRFAFYMMHMTVGVSI